MIINPDKVPSVRLEQAGKHHCRLLARTMRAEDAAEVYATGHFLPEPAVRASVNRSREAWAVYRGDDLLAVFGVSEFDQVAVAWLLTSRAVERHKLAFWKASKTIVSQLRDAYPIVTNMVDARYTAAIDWAKRLGFEVGPMETFGPDKSLFCQVVLRTKKIEAA